MSEKISMTELYEILKKLKEKEIILDVRGRDEFGASHVPGSQNIPYDEVDQHLDELKQWDKIFVYCRSGGRAQIACQVLEKLNLNNLVCIDNST